MFNKKNICLLTLNMFLIIGCGKKLENSKAKPIDTSKVEEVVQSAESLSSEDKEKAQKELLVALKSSSEALVRDKLGNLEDLNFQFENGETPLTYAIKYIKNDSEINDSTIISLVLRKHQDLNQKNEKGETPLLLALKERKNLIINKLLIEKVDIDLTDANNIAPIVYAALYTNQNYVIKFIHLGAKLNVFFRGRTFKALLRDKKYYKAFDLVKLIEAQNKSDDNIIKSITSANLEYFKFVSSRHENLQEYFNNTNVLSYAIDLDDKDARDQFLDQLIDKGAIVDFHDGLSPVIQSIVYEYEDVLEFLINKGADVNFLDEHKRHPLSYAVEINNYKMVKMILKAMSENQKHLPSNNIEDTAAAACLYVIDRKIIRYKRPEKKERRNIIKFLDCDD